MAETITCTECGANLKVAALPAPGKKMRCPKCGEPFMPERRDEDEDREKDDGRAPARSRRQRDDDDDDRDRAPRRKGSRSRRGFEFDGSAGDFFVMYLCVLLLTIFTLGLAFPWTICMFERWKAEHTIIEGRRLQFNGTGSALLGLFIVGYLLMIVTLGIYMFWFAPKMIGWVVENTSVADRD